MTTRPLLALMALLTTSTIPAEMRMFEDYEFSDTVVSMTTVKVDSGKGEQYLEGLKTTWVESNEVAKDLGQIENYSIHVSHLPDSGEFNVVLLIWFKSLGEYAPDKAKYDAFMKRWSKKREADNKEIAKSYPELREITGEHLLSEVEFK